MRWITAFLFASALAAPASAAPARAPLTEAEAAAALAAAGTCTGIVYKFDGGQRSAADYLESLPRAGDTGARWSEERADDVYALATGLLRPAIAAPERALDALGGFKCTPAPATAVRLLHFLAGPSPRAVIGPTNTYYWLGQAYRRGVGVAADPAKARASFLQARLFGHEQLTAADWGSSPADDLMALLRRPDNRALLDEAAQARWKGGPQYLLAELHLAGDPARARALLEEAAAVPNRKAALRLAALDAEGAFGESRPLRVVELLAPLARSGHAESEALLAAARRYNGSAELPVSTRQVTSAQLGGKALLARAEAMKLDSLRGRVQTRALLGPDGRILLVRLIEPSMGDFEYGRATLNLYRPEHLPRLQPEVANGRPVFAWVNLPGIDWR